MKQEPFESQEGTIEQMVAELATELEIARALALGNLFGNKVAAIDGMFDWQDHQYQIDDRAIVSMTSVLSEMRAGFSEAHGGFWVDSENTPVGFDQTEVSDLLENAIAARLDIDQAYFSIRHEISAATTVGAIQSISLEVGG